MTITIWLSTDSCFYRRMAVLAVETGTPDFAAYVGKLSAGISIPAIASDKNFDELESDVREAYESKYLY